MKLHEFKAWMEGYSSALVGPPNEEQWKLILDKLSSVQEGVYLNEKAPVYRSPTTLPDSFPRYPTSVKPSWPNEYVIC